MCTTYSRLAGGLLNLRFGEKVIIVTGTSRGIDRATAAQLPQEGAFVIGADIEPPSPDA
jgi:NAD(P)-dependent dehydrogenase (short-subunit alcohol dehydrogenase family)